MKWIFSLVVFIFLCAPAFAGKLPVIYDLEAAKTANSKTKNHFYIKTARFSKAIKAKKYKDFVRTKTSYPVKIIHKNQFFIVLIGPISTASEVRRTANHLLAGSSINLAHKLKHHSIRSKASRPSQSKWFISAGVGAAYPSFNSNLTVANNSGFPGSYSLDTYTTNKNGQAVFELMLGRRWERTNKWLPSYALGLSYLHLFTTNMGGTLTQYSAPAYTNYHYTWDTSSDAILVGGKLNLFQYHKLSPYIAGNLGCALNKSGNYSESALPGLTDTRVSAGFQTKTTTQFAYTAGAGLDLQTTRNILLSAEYQYQNLGNMSLGKGLGSWSSQSLSLGNYTTNTFLLKLTYLLN